MAAANGTESDAKETTIRFRSHTMSESDHKQSSDGTGKMQYIAWRSTTRAINNASSSPAGPRKKQKAPWFLGKSPDVKSCTKQTNKQTNKQTKNTQSNNRTSKQTNERTNTQTRTQAKLTKKPTNKQTNKQTNKRTNKQANRQTNE